VSPKLPRVTAVGVIRALRRAGWYQYSEHGSHRYFRHPDQPGKRVTVAVHLGETIKPKTLQSILEQAGLSIDLFREML